MDCEIVLYKNQSQDDSLGLLGLKIGNQLGLGQSLLGVGYINVSAARLPLNSGSNSNHDISGSFRNFLCLSSLTALTKKFSWFYDLFLSQYAL